MKIKNLFIASIALISLCLLNSCKKGQSNADTAVPVKTTNSVLDYIKSLGFKDADIKDIGNEYLVDGDILFSKKTVIDTKKTSASKIKVDQYGTQNYLGLNTNVVVRVDASMSNYSAEINSAIAQWNAVPNVRIKFSLYNGQVPYNVTISNSSLGTGICGSSYFPMNGQPGSNVFINLSYTSGMSFDQRQRTVTHEFGHIIGIMHTNWFANGEPSNGQAGNGAAFSTTHILGTPTGYDNVSLMNGGECNSGATVLSDYDKIALQFLYPLNPPVAGSVPVFRYDNIQNADHFYTTDYSELKQGSNTGYKFEGVGFFNFSTQINGTAPVYRYYSTSTGDHYYTRNIGSYSGYTYERIAFYAYPSSINGDVPVYRYYNTQNQKHFYTKDQNEFYGGNMNGYTYEDIPFYAF